MTMASSTTMPMDRIRANRVIKLIAEAQQGHGRKGADDGHRHGGGRHQRGPPILQKHHDDDEHQDAGFEQGFIDGVNGLVDKLGGVVMNRVCQAWREVLAHFRHGLAHLVGDVQGIGPGQGIDQDLRRGVAAHAAKVAVTLLAQLHPGDVPDAHDLRAFGRAGS